MRRALSKRTVEKQVSICFRRFIRDQGPFPKQSTRLVPRVDGSVRKTYRKKGNRTWYQRLTLICSFDPIPGEWMTFYGEADSLRSGEAQRYFNLQRAGKGTPNDRNVRLGWVFHADYHHTIHCAFSDVFVARNRIASCRYLSAIGVLREREKRVRITTNVIHGQTSV